MRTHHFVAFRICPCECCVRISRFQPTPYASTTETANYLLDGLKIERHADSTIATPIWKQATSAMHGGFNVLGCGGDFGQDHMQHLHNIDRLWRRLPNCEVD